MQTQRRTHTPSRDTGITFITGDLRPAGSASTGSGVQRPRGRRKVHAVVSFQGERNPSGSSPVRGAAGIHASVYSAAKQSEVSIKTFDRNGQISCCTCSVFQTTAGRSDVEQKPEESGSSIWIHHILSVALGGDGGAVGRSGRSLSTRVCSLRSSDWDAVALQR